MADAGIGETAAAEGGKSAGEAAAADVSAEGAASSGVAMSGAGATGSDLVLDTGAAAAGATAAGGTGGSGGSGSAAGASQAPGATGAGKGLLGQAETAAITAGVSKLFNPTPKNPMVPPVTPMPDPLAIEQAKKQSIIEQLARRGRASTILTNTGGGKLGG